MKYEITKFSIRFSKEKARKTRAKTVTLKSKLKELEQNPDFIFDRNYLDYKNKLEQIYEKRLMMLKNRLEKERALLNQS